MKTLLSEKQFGRLRKSIDWSQAQLEFPRRKRVQGIRQYVGNHYAESGADRAVPVNFLKMAVDIYGRLLAPKAPRVMVSAIKDWLKPTAANLELAVNQIPEEIGLADTFRQCVIEALFGWGVLKCGLCTVGTAMGHEYGDTFVDLVTPDDYFLDMSAKYIKAIQYEGNDYWVDYEDVKKSDWLPNNLRSDLQPDDHTVIGQRGEDRAEGIVGGSTADVFRERLWLRDVFLEKEQLLVTYGVKSGQQMKVVEWDGPKTGPYIKLGFSDVPGNLLPLPPVSVWRDLHALGNALFRKLGSQADSEKSVLGFSGSDDQGAEDFKNASDGDGIRYTGTEPKKLVAGGINPNTLAFYLQTRDLSSYFANNLDSLGGLSSMTETVGQDKLLSDAANAQLSDMSDKTIVAMRGVFRSLAYYEWHDPIKRRILEKPIPGTKLKMSVPWGRESKVGDFDEYDLQIDVYSLPNDSPGSKLQKLSLILERFIIPLQPFIQQAGGVVDVQAILSDVAKFSSMEEVGNYVTFMDEPPSSQQDGQSGMPANTTRTYERVGRPGTSREGASNAIQQMLVGQGAGNSGAE